MKQFATAVLFLIGATIASAQTTTMIPYTVTLYLDSFCNSLTSCVSEGWGSSTAEAPPNAPIFYPSMRATYTTGLPFFPTIFRTPPTTAPFNGEPVSGVGSGTFAWSDGGPNQGTDVVQALACTVTVSFPSLIETCTDEAPIPLVTFTKYWTFVHVTTRTGFAWNLRPAPAPGGVPKNTGVFLDQSTVAILDSPAQAELKRQQRIQADLDNDPCEPIILFPWNAPSKPWREVDSLQRLTRLFNEFADLSYADIR